MIYDSGYFKKELRQGYMENKISRKKKTTFALFSGLFSFALYFMFQPMKESIFFETFPMIMQPSYFSTVYIYIHTILFLITLYFIFYYDSLFFHEIRKNNWYFLVKMGYNPITMIFSKLIAMLTFVIYVYTVGFAFTIFLTIFLRYNMVLSYLPTLYLAGFIDLILFTLLTMTISTFINRVRNARYLIFISMVLLIMLKIKSRYYSILSNRVLMQKIFGLFDVNKSMYLPVAGIIVLICTMVFILRAKNISKYYNIVYGKPLWDMVNAPSVILTEDKKKNLKPLDNRERKARQRKIFNSVVYTLLTLNLLVALSFNIIILSIAATAPGSVVSIFGYIPYVFKSDTMEPAIMVNDLVYFKKMDSNSKIAPGNIILFEEDNIIYIERIISKDDDVLKVDIDNYPKMSQPDAMVKYINKNYIYGIYSGRSRWLGAFILFANTVFGRLTLLLVPGILLYYHKPITEKLFKENED